MACNRPLPAWRARVPNDKGRLPVVFRFQEADTSLPVNIACGRCMGCRLEKARTWAVRLLHESKLHKSSYFITLTYDDQHLPLTPTGLPTLRPIDWVLFMKRLRKRFGQDLRFYQCGEYGETTARPHHHAILFNLKLNDLVPMYLTRARNAHTLYKSTSLTELWKQGHTSVGAVTFETAAYTASYATKKLTGPKAEAHYKGRVPEYSTMSRRPGIGAGFLDKYADDIYPADEVIVRGHIMKPPKYYDLRLERRDPDTHSQVTQDRLWRPKHVPDFREREAKELTTTQQLRKRDSQ